MMYSVENIKNILEHLDKQIIILTNINRLIVEILINDSRFVFVIILY